MAISQLSDGGDLGCCFGQDANDKISFHGAAPVVQATFVANASVAHALNSTFSDTEAEAALNAMGTKVNSILAALIAKGLMASS